MRRLQAIGCFCVLCCVLWVAVATPAQGQQATERFVPIGQSPGQSGKTTSIGTVQSVDMQARSVTVAAAEGRVISLTWTDRTRIWLDRSRQQMGAIKGMASDIQIGRRVEVQPDRKDAAQVEWIKVDTGAAPS